MFYIGLISVLGGVLLRILAVRELSKYGEWSNIPKQPEIVVRTGIYRFLAHPAYTGSIMFFFGLFLIVPVEWRFLVEMIFISIIYLNRIEIENLFIHKLCCETLKK